MSKTYIRFIIEKTDPDSGQKMGVFMAMMELRESNELYDYEEEILRRLVRWFDQNLEAPKVQASDSRYYSTPMAISWYKSSAKSHIEKMREYTQILENHGILVTQFITKQPGKILYEDDYQIAAIPFNDTFK